LTGPAAVGAASDVRVVLITAPSADVAGKLVRALVEEGLAACGNVVPGVTSIYRWQGDIHTDAEVLVVLKTTAARVAALLVRAPELHPYDVPEVLVLAVEAGHAPYVAWVHASSGSGG
jgi:periplasmic divalent cation tolerance protein